MWLPMRLLLILWVAPASCLGATMGFLGLLTGGRVQRRGTIIEFHGGAVTWFLDRCPIQPMAMTLGHVVLGIHPAALDIARPHEMIHVRQYERWGPAFLPAYLLCSLVLWLQGRDAYRENPFERDAYDACGD